MHISNVAVWERSCSTRDRNRDKYKDRYVLVERRGGMKGIGIEELGRSRGGVERGVGVVESRE
jgi:hypothetical protein